MKTVTLRNVPEDLAREIEAKARELDLSLNKTVIRLLEERLCPPAALSSPLRPVRHSDLDDLIGSWSRSEADQFDECLAEQRQIDPDLWR